MRKKKILHFFYGKTFCSRWEPKVARWHEISTRRRKCTTLYKQKIRYNPKPTIKHTVGVIISSERQVNTLRYSSNTMPDNNDDYSVDGSTGPSLRRSTQAAASAPSPVFDQGPTQLRLPATTAQVQARLRKLSKSLHSANCDRTNALRIVRAALLLQYDHLQDKSQNGGAASKSPAI
jgi:hypothetical protein